MYTTTIIFIFFLYLSYLVFENNQNKKYRNKIKHVIHVNGTRGKSSTSRLIEASLRDQNRKIFCKTTGTSAMTIDTNEIEKPIIRKGRANIKEQLKIIKKAAKQGADVLVVECMAVDPELQYISQHKILLADISVVTNVRRDHLEEMGPSLKDVALALGNVMPKDGYFITAEEKFMDCYKDLGNQNNTKVILAQELNSDYGIDFKENVSIALEVCKILGIDKDVAIERMKSYKKDPGVLKTYKLNNDKNLDIKFINGLAINDPDSIWLIYEKIKNDGLLHDKEFIILINNRIDRPHRMKQHIELIIQLKPDKVWISGEFKNIMKKGLVKNGINFDSIKFIDSLNQELLKEQTNPAVIYAIGNIVGQGEKLVKYVESIGDAVV